MKIRLTTDGLSDTELLSKAPAGHREDIARLLELRQKESLKQSRYPPAILVPSPELEERNVLY